jgi:GT2 family glycosyltransferase
LKNNIVLGIGTPTLSGEIRMETVVSMFDTTSTANFPVAIFFAKGSILPDNRKKLVVDALRARCTHLLFLDADIELEKGTVQKLLAHDKFIIGGNIHKKSLPKQDTTKLLGKNGEAVIGELPNKLFECHSVATACMLIKMEVFREIDKPWFLFEYDREGNLTGEDVWFCKQARKKGFEIWCDPTIEIGHIGDFIY